MKVWGGIDPGNSGCLALIYADERIELYDAPATVIKSGKRSRTVLVPQEMANMLGSARDQHFFSHVYVEKVASMPKQGVASSFNFGMGYGMWLGVLATLRIPYTLVTPQYWKREMMRGMATYEKSASCVRAAQLFPAASDRLQRPKRGGGIIYLDGRGDALLIAELCRKEQP